MNKPDLALLTEVQRPAAARGLSDELGLCDYFDREVEATTAAYRDPWMEREQPAYAGQFEATRTIPLPVLS